MDFKKCSVCKEVKALSQFNIDRTDKGGIRAQCKTCQYKVQQQRYYQEGSKIRAKWKARDAYKTGKLQKPSCCQRCGKNKLLDRHHPNYSKPLKVIWVCRKCHIWLHSSLKSA